MRRLWSSHPIPVILLALGLLLAACSSSDSQQNGGVLGEGALPDVIALPDGFQPEGIVSGRGSELFVGSLGRSDTGDIVGGAIYRADAITGEGELLVPSRAGRTALGLGYDSRSDLIFVAGGPFGTAYVYDADTGADVASYQLTALGFPDAIVNDVVVTREAAYFTDSFRPVLYRLPLGPDGRLADPSEVEEIALSGDFVIDFVPGDFNGNGIDATPNGDRLVVANSAAGTLYLVDPATGDTVRIDLGGDAVPSGDGIVLHGKTLYVVQNFLNQIAVVELAPDLQSGTVTAFITDPEFRIPTTAARFGDSLYAVNARFDVAPPPLPGFPPADPTLEYEIVRVER